MALLASRLYGNTNACRCPSSKLSLMLVNKTNINILVADYLNLLGYSIFFPFYALFAAQIGASARLIGYGWSLNTVLTGLIALLYGLSSRKLRHERVVLVISLFMLAFSTLLFLKVSDVHQLYMVLIINACIAGFYLPSMKANYSQSLKKRNLTKGWSRFDGGNMLATAVGSAIGGSLIGLYGFRGAILAMFCLELLGALFALRLLLATK